MVRKAEFDDSIFINAAIDLIALGGPNAATMSAIAQATNAPTGSIYHRFTSRSALLGAAWCHALSSMADEVLPPLHRGDSDQTISDLTNWVEKNVAMARLIMLYDENDLIDGALPEGIYKKLNNLNKNLGAGLTALLKHNNKALTPANMNVANFAIFDGPIAAMKPILRGKLPSSNLTMEKCHAVARASCQASLRLLA